MTDGATTVRALRELVASFVAEREWGVFHDAKNLSMALTIEAAELMEHFQWLRSEQVPDAASDPAAREAICDELADVMCFTLALANVLNVDLAAEVERKMAKNRAKYPAAEFRGRYEKPPA
jgi:NTP pyrophosphatase (non-canonical NTP hydrolase)